MGSHCLGTVSPCRYISISHGFADLCGSKSPISPSHFITPLALVATFILAELSSPRIPIAPSYASSDATTSSASNPLETSALSPTPLSSLLKNFTSATALGAGTLFLFGGYGKLRHGGGSGGTDEGGGKFYPKKRGEPISPLSVIEKAASITVPYLAALELGTARTAVVVMGFAAGGMVGAGRSGMKELVVGKKGVLGMVGLAVGWDLWRGSGAEGGLSFPSSY